MYSEDINYLYDCDGNETEMKTYENSNIETDYSFNKYMDKFLQDAIQRKVREKLIKNKELLNNNISNDYILLTNKNKIIIDSLTVDVCCRDTEKLNFKFNNTETFAGYFQPITLFIKKYYWWVKYKYLFLKSIANYKISKLDLSDAFLSIDLYESYHDWYDKKDSETSTGIDLILLTNILNSNTGIEELNLSQNMFLFKNINIDILTKFFVSIETNTTLKKLVIKNTYIPKNVLNNLIKAIRLNPNITSLTLENIEFGDYLDYIYGNSTMQGINNQGKDNIELFLCNIPKYKRKNCDVEQNKYDFIIRELGKSKSLTQLNMINFNFINTFNQYASNGCFSNLFNNKLLTDLNFSYCSFNKKNIKNLASGINCLTSLENIVLNGTNIFKPSELIKNNSSVIAEDFKLPEKVGDAFAGLTNLNKLCLAENGINDNNFYIIENIIANNNNIRYLDLCRNNLHHAVPKLSQVLLTQCRNLECLNLQNVLTLYDLEDPIGEIKRYLEIIKLNKKLKSLSLTFILGLKEMVDSLYTDNKITDILTVIDNYLIYQRNLEYFDLKIEYRPRINLSISNILSVDDIAKTKWDIKKLSAADGSSHSYRDAIQNRINLKLESRKELVYLFPGFKILNFCEIDKTTVETKWGLRDKYNKHIIKKGELLLYLHNIKFINLLQKTPHIKRRIIKNILSFIQCV